MGFTDWVKRRTKDSPEMAKPGAELSEADKKLFAEWTLDYRLARQRDETGREPESVQPEVSPAPKTETPKQPAKRRRVRGHDLPF